MPFTQEKKTNIRKWCHGCEEHCEFGTITERSLVLAADNTPLNCMDILPTLAGRPIHTYLDKFGKEQSTSIRIVNGKFVATDMPVTDKWIAFMKETQLERAYNIAKLCDNYKAR